MMLFHCKKLNRVPGGKGIHLVLICYVSMILSACSAYHDASQRFEQKKMCQMQCEQKYQYCMGVCDDNERLCRVKSTARAAVHFTRYQHQEKVKGHVVMEELQAFHDPLACRKTTCDCDLDKGMCKQACRGFIYKRLQSAMQLN